ncbi:nitrilase-related carbon-nitrogen hydrolase [Candidatus Riflebacteria bacterium]
MSALNLAWLQMDIQWQSPLPNLKHVEEILRVNKGLNKTNDSAPVFWVLPEMFSTGFCMDIGKIADNGKTYATLSELAKKFQIYLLCPIVLQSSTGMGQNVAIVFNPEGQEISRYQKIFPFSFAGEDLKYEKGNEISCFELSGFLVSIFICYDLRFPEVFRHAVLKGAKLFIVPSSWPDKRIGHFRHLLVARAIENQCYVLGVNRLGKDPKQVYNGQSLLVDPLGKILVDSEDRPGAFFHKISLDKLQDYREKFPAISDIQPGFLGIDD